MRSIMRIMRSPGVTFPRLELVGRHSTTKLVLAAVADIPEQCLLEIGPLETSLYRHRSEAATLLTLVYFYHIFILTHTSD